MDAVVRAVEPGDWARLQQFPSAVQFRSNLFLVAVSEGSLTAFLAWRRLAPDESEILHLETLGSFRKKGFARLLVRSLKKQEPATLFLEVRPSNIAAIQLYDSEGFIEISRRQDYYSDPPEQAIVLKFHS